MSTRKIAASTLWQLSSQAVMAALSVVAVKLVTIGLSIELAGVYNTAYGYLQIFGILADFGLYAVAVREVARADDRQKVLGVLMTLRAIILGISLASALTIAWVIPHWQGTPLPLAITIASLVPAFTLLAGIIRTAFQVEYRMHYVFIAEIAQEILTLALCALLVLLGFRNSADVRVLYLFLGIGGVGALLVFILFVVFSRRVLPVRPRWDGPLLRRMLLLSAPYGFAFLCTTLYRQSDLTLISLLRPADFAIQNGYYGFVQRIMDMSYLLPTFLLNSTLPILSDRDAKGEDARDLLGHILLSTLILGSVAALFSALWARPVLLLITAEKYLSTSLHPGADTALSTLSVSMFMNGLITYSFYILLTKHRWQRLVATLSIGVVVSLGLNLFLIPQLGFVGACYTSIVTHTLLALLLLPQALSVMRARITGKMFLQWMGFSILLLGFLLLSRPLLINSLMTMLLSVIAVLWIGACVWLTGLHKTARV